MKKMSLVAAGLLVGAGVAAAFALARKKPEPPAPPVAVAADPTSIASVVAASSAAASASSASQDTELGRLVLPPTPDGVRGKAPTDEEWASAGVSLALPRASRCMGSVLEGWVRLECESKKGAGHSVAALSGSLAKVAVHPRAHGLTQIVFPITRGDRRMFQLEEVEIQATGEGYRGEIREGVVVPSVVVSVVWLETENNPRIVVTDV